MQTKSIEQYFLFGLLILTFVFTFFIFQPFLMVLILGASFAIVLYPIHKWFKKLKFPNALSAICTVLLFVLVLCVPLFTIGTVVFNQSQNIYNSVAVNGNIGPFLTSIGEKINSGLPHGIVFNTSQVVSTFTSFLTNNIANVFNTTLSTIVSFVLLLLVIFYLLKDGSEWKKKVILLSPLSEENDQKIVARLSKTINGVIKGSVLVALIQGILMWAGLTLFGVPNSALWALLAAIAALIPPFGTGLISIPAIIFLYATRHILPAIGLFAWTIVVFTLVDNYLSPYIVGRKVEIPPFLILFSVLGGIAMLGPVGILIGPITISLLHTLVSIYKNESNENKTL